MSHGNAGQGQALSFPVKDGDFQGPNICPKGRWYCVTVAVKPEGVAVRDSKDIGKTTLRFTHDEWSAFVKSVKAGQFDVGV